MIYIIENTSKSKVLGTKSDGEVIEEDFDGNRTEQLWVKGEPNNEGYFTVTTSESKLLLSANSFNKLVLLDAAFSKFIQKYFIYNII